MVSLLRFCLTFCGQFGAFFVVMDSFLESDGSMVGYYGVNIF